MAKTTAPPRPEIMCLHAPPIMMTEMSAGRARGSIAPVSG
jgi:hypothetical protein